MDPVDGWQFKESPAYLRSLGALDETEPQNPRIIIPNYINAPGNCFANGKFYQSCCINECENLQLHIESALQSFEPEPHQIVAVVKGLSSASVSANNMLSMPLRTRLVSIAEMHGGRVPLQGRLFAQWMHFAFPRECPFPHKSGTTNPTELHVNTDVDGQFVTDKVAASLIQAGRALPRASGNGTCMQWRREEELFVPTVHPAHVSLAALEEDSSVWDSVRIMTMMSSITMMMATLLSVVRKNKLSTAADIKPAKQAKKKDLFIV
jgi:hypothetical protein